MAVEADSGYPRHVSHLCLTIGYPSTYYLWPDIFNGAKPRVQHITGSLGEDDDHAICSLNSYLR